tara:strand:+ start:13812 stop:14576 length:765 start_codon:yes stop_codon:yes gene_type:complete
MDEFAADPSHPRYESLLKRHELEQAAKKGMLAGSALIAHGRGEAYDYLLGEQTIPSAMLATKFALQQLKDSEKSVISLNGNTTAIAGVELMKLASLVNCPVEVNIFYRTPERMKILLEHLESINRNLGLKVKILGADPDSLIPGLEGPRANCCSEGIFSSEVILVPLEDGDRCEALVAMGKTVIVVDLNPLSRSSKMASITIVDEISRVAKNMLSMIENKELLTEKIDFDNSDSVKNSVEFITKSLAEKFNLLS